MSKHPDIEAELAEFLEQNSIQHRPSGGSWILTCPRCEKLKLYMFRKTGNFTCWTCENPFHGRPEFALSEIVLRPVQKIREDLYKDKPFDWTPYLGCICEKYDLPGLKNAGKIDNPECKVCFPEAEPPPPAIPEIPIPLDWFPLDDPKAARGVEYLATRGIDLETAKSYGIWYSPPERSIIFPVMFDDRLVGWQSRVTYVPGKGPKALTSKGMPRERVVMFEHTVTADHAIVCEGPIDAIKTKLCGGGVATLGKKVNQGQIDRLVDLGVRKFYLALDWDAWQESARLSQVLLGAGFEVFAIRTPEGADDLGEMTPERVLEVFRAAPRVNARTLWYPRL